jgi:hypothetical protein
VYCERMNGRILCRDINVVKGHCLRGCDEQAVRLHPD